jgi:hypothetical protein
MHPTELFEAGNYRYIPSVFQYSAGVKAEPGFCLEQVRFHRALPLQDGFEYAKAHLQKIGRPLTAFAHCELRSPTQFDDQGFIAFNRQYVAQLEAWGIYTPAFENREAINPVARTNVCPKHHAPRQVSMFSFTYSVPVESPRISFVLSGGGDARKGPEPYRDRIIAYGDCSPEGLKIKIAFVIDEMTARLRKLDLTWNDATKVQAYTIHDIAPWIDELLSNPGLIPNGLTWHYAKPPVAGLEYEMDVRGGVSELFIN